MFAVPASSAQIERDFGNSGRMVTQQRTSLLSPNIDMCSFLSSNRQYVDITQCEQPNKSKLESHIPSSPLLALNEVAWDDDPDGIILQTFSAASMDDFDMEQEEDNNDDDDDE